MELRHLLRDYLKPGVQLYTVAASHHEAIDVNKRIWDHLPENLPDSFADQNPTGFTEFMRSGRLISFLDM